jgi:hypothetical protein
MLPPMTDASARTTIPSTRDNTFSIMVFSGIIGHTRMTEGRAKMTSICQQPVEKLEIVGIHRVAGADASVVSGDEGGQT